jgi:hypothetical protein
MTLNKGFTITACIGWRFIHANGGQKRINR